MMDVTRHWYIGRGEAGLTRLKNLLKLAEKLTDGNFSKFINEAVNKHYHLNPETGAPLPRSKTKK